MSETEILELSAPPLAASPTVAALELPQTLAVIARFAATDVGAERLQGLRPSLESEDVVLRRAQLAELAPLLAIHGALIASQDQPLADWLPALTSTHGGLDGRDLYHIGRLLDIVTGAASAVRAAEPPCPLWTRRLADELVLADELRLADELAKEPGSDLESLSDLAAAIRRTLDSEGEVRPDASDALLRLSSAARSRRERLHRSFEGYVQEHREQLGEDTISARDGRLSVLLPAGHRGRLEGLIHGRSATGRSYYFEPLELVDANNELRRAVGAVEEEHVRLLRDLEERVRSQAPAIVRCVELVAELDLQQAALRWGAAVGATVPEIDDRGEAGGLRILDARHPLLDPRLADHREAALGAAGNRHEVVPLELDFAPDRVLVITGPNAGGKTVALKTVGLLALLAACGLPVPAATGTRLPPLERVIALVGDDQDLLADRSTFSARLLRLKEVWEAADDGALILVDELGSGTNPQEGAALGVALLEGLLDSGCRAVLTTHLVEIASRAMALEGARCLAMEFDAEGARPTFRLRSGAPGGSEAITLARGLGLPERWIERAEQLLGPEHRDLREMLAETDRLRRELREDRALIAAELERQQELGRRLEEEHASAVKERSALRQRLERELVQFKREVRAKLEQAVEALPTGPVAGNRRKVAERATQRLFADPPTLPPEPAPEFAEAGDVEVGDWVQHLGLGWRGRLESLDDERAECSVAGKRVRCLRRELVAERKRPPSERARGRSELPSADERPELQLVGERVEPALERLERYLDRVLLANLPRVRIVHGHGTGQLRRAVRQRLALHPAVAGWRPAGEGEGGDGATVVTMKGG